MAEGGGRQSTSRRADKLALLVAADPTVPPFPQSQQQCGSAAAHRAPYQHSFDNSPPSRDEDHTGLDGEPVLFVGTLLFPPHFSTPPLSHFCTFSESASCVVVLFFCLPPTSLI